MFGLEVLEAFQNIKFTSEVPRNSKGGVNMGAAEEGTAIERISAITKIWVNN
jgi:hypothetical protein